MKRPPLTRAQQIRRWWKALLWRDFFASRIMVLLVGAMTRRDPEWDGAARELQNGEVAFYAYLFADVLLDESVRPRFRATPPRQGCAISEGEGL